MFEKIKIYPEVEQLVRDMKILYTKLADKDGFKEEKELKPFTFELHKLHLRKSPDLYAENASKILDFFVLQAPAIVLRIISNSHIKITAAAAVALRLKKHINNAALYLDGGIYFMPFITTKKLYTKMIYVEWFLKKLEPSIEKLDRALPPSLKNKLGVSPKAELAKRLTGAKIGLDSYESDYKLDPRPSFKEIDEELARLKKQNGKSRAIIIKKEPPVKVTTWLTLSFSALRYVTFGLIGSVHEVSQNTASPQTLNFPNKVLFENTDIYPITFEFKSTEHAIIAKSHLPQDSCTFRENKLRFKRPGFAKHLQLFLNLFSYTDSQSKSAAEYLLHRASTIDEQYERKILRLMIPATYTASRTQQCTKAFAKISAVKARTLSDDTPKIGLGVTKHFRDIQPRSPTS